jgi:sulfotransferase
MKNLFFLSGLPRSGSTLLGSILSQHHEIQVTPTSPLSDLLCLIDENFSKLDIQYTYNKENITNNIYKSILENFYNHLKVPHVIDKHHAWPRNLQSVYKFTGKSPKVIATHRRVSEIISSYITLIEKNNQEDNFIDNHLRRQHISINMNTRVEYLWRNYASEPYESLVFGLRHFRSYIHLVNYNDLINFPEEEMNKIYKFLEIPNHSHDFSGIINTCVEEKDHKWGLNNLHTIHSKLQMTSEPPEDIIGKENTLLFDKFNI